MSDPDQVDFIANQEEFMKLMHDPRLTLRQIDAIAKAKGYVVSLDRSKEDS